MDIEIVNDKEGRFKSFFKATITNESLLENPELEGYGIDLDHAIRDLKLKVKERISALQNIDYEKITILK